MHPKIVLRILDNIAELCVLFLVVYSILGYRKVQGWYIAEGGRRMQGHEGWSSGNFGGFDGTRKGAGEGATKNPASPAADWFS